MFGKQNAQLPWKYKNSSIRKNFNILPKGLGYLVSKVCIQFSFSQTRFETLKFSIVHIHIKEMNLYVLSTILLAVNKMWMYCSRHLGSLTIFCLAFLTLFLVWIKSHKKVYFQTVRKQKHCRFSETRVRDTSMLSKRFCHTLVFLY